MAVTVDAAHTLFGTAPLGTSSSTVGLGSSSGSDRLLIIGVMDPNGGARVVTAATYAGAALTNSGSTGTNPIWRVWTKTAPATGANTLALTHSDYGTIQVTYAFFNGVDQTTPVGEVLGNSGNSSTPSTSSITCPVNGMTYGGMHTNYLSGGTPPSATTGTLLDSTGGSGSNSYAHSHHNATEAMAWSQASSSTWQSFGLPVNPVADSTFIAAPHRTILSAAKRASEY